MKLLVFSDLHMDAVTAGLQRFEDIRNALLEVVNKAISSEFDCVVFAGDLCNPDSGSIVIRALHAAMLAARALGEANIPSIWIAGNHDVVDDGTGRTTLSPISAVCSMGGSCPMSMVQVVERAPRVIVVKGVDILCLPYPSRVSRYEPDAEVEKLYPGFVSERPVIAIGHLDITGALLGSEMTDFARGSSVQWPVTALSRLGVRMSIGGHYHRVQMVNSVVMVGSLERLRFDECDNRPGWLEVEVKGVEQ
jgi:DNA repair exonuclease SbcCD nuclease subunit